MKRIVIVCGLIAGAISTSWMLGYASIAKSDTNLDNGAIYGYTAMILAFSLIYVGVRNFRNKYNGGVISFGKAFRMGLYISLIASTMYVAAWIVAYYTFLHDFVKICTGHSINKLRESGTSAAVIAQKTAEMDSFVRMYENPLFNALLTYSEILPVGIIASLITAFVLRRKKI